jgi:hypothetical protein
MTKRTIALAAFIVLVAMTRLLAHTGLVWPKIPPNFAPITAMAVFAAIRFGSRRTALIAPLVTLFLSDLGIDVLYRLGLSREWGIYKGMWVVYGTTFLIALMARLAHGTRSPVTIAVTTLAGSCLFFVVTNFGVWAAGSLYPPTVEGLEQCYVAAIPFFRNGVVGDLFFATILFGAWALAEARFPVLAPATRKS